MTVRVRVEVKVVSVHVPVVCSLLSLSRTWSEIMGYCLASWRHRSASGSELFKSDSASRDTTESRPWHPPKNDPRSLELPLPKNRAPALLKIKQNSGEVVRYEIDWRARTPAKAQRIQADS